MKKICIATLGFIEDYRQQLLPFVIESMGYRIEWVKPEEADIVIFGPQFQLRKQSLRRIPKIFRKYIQKPFVENLQTHLGSRKQLPIRIFHALGNCRHDQVSADYSISSDITFGQENHFRLPQWMERVNWSEQGVRGNGVRLNGPLLDLGRLSEPLGAQFITRVTNGERSATFIADTLREPNLSCLKAIQSVMRVDGFGNAFDLKSPTSSSFMVNFENILERYAFNLCPEAGLYPAYVSDKIPVAFSAGCLPITWVDQSICVDFNPNAFINLADMAAQEFSGMENLLNENYLRQYADQALLVNKPSLEPLKAYLQNIITQALD